MGYQIDSSLSGSSSCNTASLIQLGFNIEEEDTLTE